MSEPLQWERKDGHDYVASVELGDNTLTAVIDVKEDHFFWHVDTVRAYLDMGSSENAGRAATLAEAKREAADPPPIDGGLRRSL